MRQLVCVSYYNTTGSNRKENNTRNAAVVEVGRNKMHAVRGLVVFFGGGRGLKTSIRFIVVRIEFDNIVDLCTSLFATCHFWRVDFMRIMPSNNRIFRCLRFKTIRAVNNVPSNERTCILLSPNEVQGDATHNFFMKLIYILIKKKQQGEIETMQIGDGILPKTPRHNRREPSCVPTFYSLQCLSL